MVNKLDLKERIKKAEKQKKFRKPEDLLNKEDLRDLLNNAMKEIQTITNGEVSGTVKIIELKDVTISKRLEELRKENGLNHKGDFIFITFTANGYIMVVGAGTDIKFSNNKKYVNANILEELEEKWDTDEIILIPIKGLKGNGLKRIDNVLECRNGVENFIGCYLAEKVPVLNYYQHWNYKEEIWSHWKENNFQLNTRKK